MIPFNILLEDEEIVVIEKPAGTVVNNAESAKNMTVQQWAEGYLKVNEISPKSQIEEEFFSRGGVVHRLDKETSGVLIIAKNASSFENLKNQFKSRNVKKKYTALVHGFVSEMSGEIDAPIGRLPWNRTRFGVLEEGRDAKTVYSVLEYRTFEKIHEKNLTLLELFPKTGRTHQIRVHLRHIGHTIFADELYAGRKISRIDRKFLGRHFLHASELTLNHPVSDAKLTLKSSLPRDLEDFLSSTNRTNYS